MSALALVLNSFTRSHAVSDQLTAFHVSFCSPRSPDSTFVIAFQSRPDNLDPFRTRTARTASIFSELLSLSLLAIDPDSGDLMPWLATSTPTTEDGVAHWTIRPGAAWAGCYDMNLFDHNAFVGGVSGMGGFYLALGFSGHGLHQSPAVGRGLAELIATGAYQSLDLSPRAFERLAANAPIVEKNVV